MSLFGQTKFGIYASQVAALIQRTITPGTAEEFEPADTNSISIAALTSTKAIVCYEDEGGQDDGSACILDISGTTVTAGSVYDFNDGNTAYISVARLSDTKAIVCYTDLDNANRGMACILDVSGTVITPGSGYIFNGGATAFSSVAMLTSTKAIVVYQDDSASDKGQACILDVSGTVITPGSEYIFNGGITDFSSVAMLTSTKAIVCYEDLSNSYYGTACILDVSGTVITPGSEYVFNSGTTPCVSVAMLTSTKAIVAYTNDIVNYYGNACILDVSGTVITPGSEYTFNSAATADISIAVLTSTKAIVAYRDNPNINRGTACILDVSGTVITPGSEYTFSSGHTTYISVAALASLQAIVAYRDAGLGYDGHACTLNVS
jgi:hypothetical protein